MYLGLGSNLGDRFGILQAAIRDLSALRGFVLLRTAGWYTTAAMGKDSGEPFINTAVAGLFDGPATELLKHCQAIEKQYGRTRPYAWAPRTLDIDLLWWEGIALDTAELTLPHPRLRERAFAVVPLLEIAPHLVDTVTGDPLSNALTPQLLRQGIEPYVPLAEPRGVVRV